MKALRVVCDVHSDWISFVSFCVGVGVGMCLQGTTYIQSVAAGYYSEPENGPPTTRYFQTVCPVGYYCAGGVRRVCAAGRFGAVEGLSTVVCSGPCAGGYYCPPMSVTATAIACGNTSVYCPQGSDTPLIALPGELTTGGTESTRTSAELCPGSLYCVEGVAEPCPAGRFGCATGLGSPLCTLLREM